MAWDDDDDEWEGRRPPSDTTLEIRHPSLTPSILLLPAPCSLSPLPSPLCPLPSPLTGRIHVHGGPGASRSSGATQARGGFHKGVLLRLWNRHLGYERFTQMHGVCAFCTRLDHHPVPVLSLLLRLLLVLFVEPAMVECSERTQARRR